MEKKGLTKVQKEVLSFYKDFIPLEILMSNSQFLPEETKLPKIDAKDDEILLFYLSITPKGVSALIKRLSDLDYPILDMTDLVNQLGGLKNKFNQTEIDIISSLRITDFPLKTIKSTLPMLTTISIMEKLANCQTQYRECVKNAKDEIPAGEELTEALKNCKMEYEMCQPGVANWLFLAMLAGIGRGRLPICTWCPPWPRANMLQRV